MNLPSDTPCVYIHADVRNGRLGVLSVRWPHLGDLTGFLDFLSLSNWSVSEQRNCSESRKAEGQRAANE